MSDYDGQHEIYERLSGLEQRMKTVEHTLDLSSNDIKTIRDDLKHELSRQSEELALTRQAVRIFEDTVRGLDIQIRAMASESKEILTMLQDHLVTEAKEKTKVLIGLATAGATGLGTLGILIWGVLQVLHNS
jgi:hypothetical protein